MTLNQPLNPSQIDNDIRGNHYHLTEDDQCFYFDEYIVGAGYQDPAYSRVHNFKIKPNTPNQSRLIYKKRAIQYYAERIAGAVENSVYTFIPAPSSKSSTHPEYDDRLIKCLDIARKLKPENIVIRDCFFATGDRESFHNDHNGGRRDIELLRNNIGINAEELQRLLNNLPRNVVFLDDVLTTGCTFKACYAEFEKAMHDNGIEELPRFKGLFLARRKIIPAVEDFDFFNIGE